MILRIAFACVSMVLVIISFPISEFPTWLELTFFPQLQNQLFKNILLDNRIFYIFNFLQKLLYK